SLNSFLEETNTFHNSLPKFENFYFDLGEISGGSTTTHSDISLPDYEAFYFDDDHVNEISSGSTTTHSNISLSEYDSFIFDLTHEEFVDELAHIISSPEYDRFYFKDLPDQGGLMSLLNFRIRENLSTTLVNLPIEDDHSPLLAYVVWIFLAYLTYPVIPPYLHPFGNEDTIFNLGITINHFYSFNPVSSHRHGAFKKFNTHQISSGNTTTHSDISLPEYEVFYVKEIIAPYYLLSLKNEDTIFDPGICNSHFSRPDISYWCGTFSRFKVLPESPMEIFSSTCSPMDK
nr:hypothetical protein [Tanacetum cinerariifolium]